MATKVAVIAKDRKGLLALEDRYRKSWKMAGKFSQKSGRYEHEKDWHFHNSYCYFDFSLHCRKEHSSDIQVSIIRQSGPNHYTRESGRLDDELSSPG